MRRVLMLVTVWILMGVGVSWGGNEPDRDVTQMVRRRMGAMVASFAQSGCLPAVPSSSLTFEAFACTGTILTSGMSIPVVQGSAGVGPLNGGDGTYWLALHRDTTTAVGGWTRQALTHYLWQKNAAEPATPSQGMLLARVTVATGAITAVTDYRVPVSYARARHFDVTDPLYGMSADPAVDASAAIQAALTASRGRCVLLPERVYVVETALTYATTGSSPGLCLLGAGMRRTVFDNQVASGAMLSLNGSVTSSTFQYGVTLKDFSITTTTSPSASHGIDIRGAWFGMVEGLCIGGSLCTDLSGATGLSGDGLRFTIVLGDADSSTSFSIRRNHITDNGGIGIHFNSATSVNALGFMQMHQNVITRNTGGGVFLQTLGASITQNAITQNGGVGGLVIDYDGVGNRNIDIRLNQFDANAAAHITADAILGLTIVNNEFKHQNVTPPGSYGPTTAIILGDGTNGAQGVLIANNDVVSVPTNPSSATDFVFINPTGPHGNITIRDNYFPAFSGANATRFDDAGGFAQIIDESRVLHERIATTLASVAAGTTVTPDAFAARYYRYSVSSGAGTLTIGAPTNPFQGQELLVDVFNGLGSETVVAWNAVFKGVKSWVLTASGGRNTARFLYDVASGNWVAQGMPAGQGQTYKASNGGPAIGAISASIVASFTTTVTGAVSGCVASSSPRSSLGTACAGSTPCFVWSAAVTATNTVTTFVHNVDAGASRTPNDVPWDIVTYCP